MTPDIQDTLFQLFEHVRHDPETFPAVPLAGWQEGSMEWRLLESFRSMVEQVQERILQLRQAKEQLREREEQYRSIFESTYDAINIIDLDGFFVEVNPAFCSMFGLIRILGDQRCDSLKSMYISSSETRVDHSCSRGSPHYEPGSVS